MHDASANHPGRPGINHRDRPSFPLRDRPASPALRAILGTTLLLLTALAATPASSPAASTVPTPPLSPTALVASSDGQSLYVACATAGKVVVFSPTTGRPVRDLAVSAPPSGLALSADNRRLYVTCAAPASHVAVLDTATGTTLARLPAGHTAMSPVLSPDGSTLYVCNRFNDAVSVFELATGKELARIPVRREPVAAAITPDGRHLLVANHLHDGRADLPVVAASVTVIDVAGRKVLKDLPLPNGSGVLNDVRISPDGRYAIVTHLVARHSVPTTQLERGWMMTNAGTLIDLQDVSVVNTVLFDTLDSGAANPWGATWANGGRSLIVAHAGTHELSLVDFPALLARLAQVPSGAEAKGTVYVSASRMRADVPNDLAFLHGIRERVKLPAGDRGPRAVALVGGRVYTANYFSDTLSRLDPSVAHPVVETLALRETPASPPSPAREGEAWFHDATLCFQGWQSCASCHPGDARVDALNWDLLNDGLGNPKNNKSLLLALRTPPAMSLGIRETGEAAVRAGIRHILFTVQPEEVPLAMEAYLASLEPVPSQWLEKGRPSAAARRGRRIFNRSDVGCATCHPPGLFTDLLSHDVGSRGRFEQETDRFDTPTLVEVWRTAPYLHDGSAASVRELFTDRNPADRHGRTSHLSLGQLNDLIAYVLSL